MIPNLRTCTRCIMDETASDIVFDDDGVCNFCTGYLEKQAKHLAPTEDERERRATQVAALHPGIKRLLNPHAFPVGLERSLYERRAALVRTTRDGNPTPTPPRSHRA